MTREEAIECLKTIQRWTPDWDDREDGLSYWDAIDMALSALRPVSRERVEKFKEYFDDLYGKGLEVYGWHLNGEPKPFDDFYEDACKYAGL